METVENQPLYLRRFQPARTSRRGSIEGSIKLTEKGPHYLPLLFRLISGAFAGKCQLIAKLSHQASG